MYVGNFAAIAQVIFKVSFKKILFSPTLAIFVENLYIFVGQHLLVFFFSHQGSNRGLPARETVFWYMASV